MRAPVLTVLALALVTSGALGAPYPRDVTPFAKVERDHFDAIVVAREQGTPTDELLVVRVHRLGDAVDADLAAPFAWLLLHAGVRVVDDPRGVPLFLTRGDLAATSGRGTLGATLPSGMAVEVGHPRVTDCVVAHEILHFLGLRHVPDPANIMFPQCTRGHLDKAVLEAWQLETLRSLDRIRATTPSGVQTWASRG